MLQQTQVTTVIPYFQKFMRSFPDVNALAHADIDQVLHHWSGLGYYARARNLHKSAGLIRDRHGGQFPTDFDDVMELPGIGRSTAGAILSLALQQPYAILDGNVKRVLARHSAIPGWPGSVAVANQLWEVAEQYTPTDSVAAYNQAMMDLGATVCKRSQPDCRSCPVNKTCIALAEGHIDSLPGRKPKKLKPHKTTRMLILQHDNLLYLERRPPSGIWGGLWSFPELSVDSDLDQWCENNLHGQTTEVTELQVVRHSFTHFDLDIQPTLVRVESASQAPFSGKVADSDAGWYATNSLPPIGLAAPVERLMRSI